MCGIAGGLALLGVDPVDERSLHQMLGLLAHRGPEAAGVFSDRTATLGHARLSIVDVAGGRQPIPNEDESAWVVVNGEVYNHPELRAELQAQGHRFRTRSDSEVLLHLYEERGDAFLSRLNGQFAFALWDGRRRRLLLGRDRLGVRPLFYTVVAGSLLFASEIKALLADPRVPRAADPRGLDEVFTYWSVLPGRTAFAGIQEVPAGHYLVAEPGGGQPVLCRYWAPEFACRPDGADEQACADELRDLLIDAVRLRLRADVPVGAYLSGGLDSSAIAAVVARHTTNRLQTFSVTFADRDFDERRFSARMAAALGTEHHVIECRERDIGAVFPEVVWHAETPLLRTAPAPLFLLSALVRRHGLKVVLTGEGADEFFAGYNIFKEAIVRRFWSRAPNSRLRPLLLRRLYDWVPDLQRSPQAYLEAFFRQGMTETTDPVYSHALRWRNTQRLKRFFSAELREELAGTDSRRALDGLLAPELGGWDPLSQAQYLEVLTFLTPYLLSSQGDRMSMAHSVEGRFPFLDHRLVEFATALPAHFRMLGLNEKRLLKRAVKDLVPADILRRPKQPYRAPISAAFCGPQAPEYVAELLSPAAVRAAGLFNPVAVARLHDKCRAASAVSESDNMALVGVLSTQLWHDRFIRDFSTQMCPVRSDVVTVGAGGTAPAGSGVAVSACPVRGDVVTVGAGGTAPAGCGVAVSAGSGASGTPRPSAAVQSTDAGCEPPADGGATPDSRPSTAAAASSTAALSDGERPPPRTGRNIAALGGGQLLTWTMTLLWTFVVPRQLGPSGMGLIVSGWAVAGVLGTVLGLGTRNYLVREIVVDKSRAPQLIGTALMLRLCLTPLFIVAVVAYTRQARYGAEGTLVVWLAAGATMLTLLADPLQAGFQAMERMEYLAYSEVINKSAQGLLGVALALVGFRSVGLTACWFIATGVVVLANALWLRPLSRVELRTSAGRIGAMAKHSLAYWAFGLFFMVYLWIDSIMLSLMTRPEVVGWYGVPTRLFQTMMFVPVIVSTAWLPRLVAAFTDGPEQLRQVARRPVELVLLLSLPIAAGTAVVAGPLIRLLYGPAYEQAVPVLVLLGSCIPFMYLNTMLGTVVIAAKRQIVWTWVMVGATLLNPLLNAALITITENRYHNGAIGAALSLLGTEIVMVGVGFAVAGRYVLDGRMVRRFAVTAAASATLALAGYAARPLGTVASFVAAVASFALVSLALRVVTPTEIAAARSAARRALRRVPTLIRGRLRRASPVLSAEGQQP